MIETQCDNRSERAEQGKYLLENRCKKFENCIKSINFGEADSREWRQNNFKF